MQIQPLPVRGLEPVLLSPQTWPRHRRTSGKTATRVSWGATSLSRSIHFGPRLGSWTVKPVILPLGVCKALNETCSATAPPVRVMNSRHLIETSTGSWFLGPERKHLLRANRGRYANPIHIQILRLL